jgi:hypothetical protein
MKRGFLFGGVGLLALLVPGMLGIPKAAAQTPVVTPVIVDTAAPIVVGVIKPRPKASGLVKFQGFVLHANIAQVTVRAKNDERAIQTFPLGEKASAKMQQIVDKGGYQYGDKITVYYDPQSLKAIKFKGKPSPSL